MFFYRIFRFLGWLLAGLGSFMLLTALFASLNSERHEMFVFLASAALTFFFAAIFIITARGQRAEISRLDICLTLFFSWIFAALFAAAPIYALLEISLLDSWFESVSAVTTTGASLTDSAESLSDTIRLWKALLSWLGGFLTIVMAFSFISALDIGGMSIRKFAQLTPPQAVIAAAIPYLFLSLLCFLALWIAGESIFNAALTTGAAISTGALDITQTDSPAPLASACVLALFLLLGAMNFGHHYSFLTGKLRAYFDPETRLFLIVFLIILILWSAYLFSQKAEISSLILALVLSASLLSTSGYVPEHLIQNLSIPVAPVLFILLIGGMTLSTAGGLKIMRIALLFRRSGLEIARLSQPSGILSVKYNNSEINFKIMQEVWLIFLAMILSILVVAAVLSAYEVNFVTSLMFAVGAITNAGPVPELLLAGAPAAPSYATFSSPTLMLLSFAMIAGRVEIVVILSIFFSLFSRE